MDADLTIGICNFNTTELTNACIKSILKQCKSRHFKIVVLDNSTTDPFVLDKSLKNQVTVLDNTRGRFIDMDLVLKIYGLSYDTDLYGSLKHAQSIQFLIDMCLTRWFLLFDSDIIVRRDLDFLDNLDSELIGMFDVGQRKTYKPRARPFIQLFNICKMRCYDLQYFDPQRIRGGMNPYNSTSYDTGASFLEDIQRLNLKYQKIDFTDYGYHLRSGSFHPLKTQMFLKKYRQFYYENTIKDPDLEYKVIVSLTSWEKRIKNGSLAKTLKSLLAQKFNGCYKIVLTLTRHESKMLQDDVQLMINTGKVELLTIDEDLKPHNKYYYVMLKHRSVPIITVDDDLVYDDDLVQTLFNAYKEFPECISARRVHLMTYSGMQLNPYRSWKYECKDIVMHPKFELFATGVGGVLYPENILQMSEAELTKIKRVLNADDIYLKKREQELGIQTVFAVGARYPGYEAQPSSVDPESLCFMNNTRTRCDNDIYIKALRLS